MHNHNYWAPRLRPVVVVAAVIQSEYKEEEVREDDRVFAGNVFRF